MRKHVRDVREIKAEENKHPFIASYILQCNWVIRDHPFRKNKWCSALQHWGIQLIWNEWLFLDDVFLN